MVRSRMGCNCHSGRGYVINVASIERSVLQPMTELYGKMTVNKANIGGRLKYLRLANRMTQQELAAVVAGGINYTMIGKVERGEVLPSVMTLMKLAAALKTRVSYFFGEDKADGTVLELSAHPRKSWLISKLQSVDSDDLELLCEVVRLLEKYGRLHPNLSHGIRGRSRIRKSAPLRGARKA